MESLLNRSIEQKQKLEMIYLASNGELSQRIFRVIEVKEDGILAYCYSRRQVRTFKKENILSLNPYRSGKKMEATV